MDAWEIKEALRSRIDAMLSELLPGGTRDGRYYRVAGVHGGRGNSCVVHLTRSERWQIGDFYENAASGGETFQKGSILDLFMAAKNISDVGDGIKEAKNWCGIVEYKRTKAMPVSNISIQRKYNRWPVDPDSKVGKYLTEERMIPLEILRKYHVCEGKVPWPNPNKDGEKWIQLDTIVFEFLDQNGNYLGSKYLAVDRPNGKKLIRSESGMDENHQHLWGLNAIDKNAKEIVICEGEIDAMSVAACGYNALSIPFGAKGDGQKWIENDFEYLDRFELIKVLMDSDAAGKKEALAMIPRLNINRTENIEIYEPCKDANELFSDNPDYLKTAIENSTAITPEKLKKPGFFAKEIWNEFFPVDGNEPGDPLPFNCPGFRLRPGEVDIWTGYPKHGKTNMLNWIMNNEAARFGRKIGLASLEIKAAKTLRNLLRQSIGIRRPTDANGNPDKSLFNKALTYLDRQFYVFDAIGRARLDDILDTFSWAVRKYGLDFVVIDSLMKLDVSKDDLQRQSDLLDKLTCWARDNNVHVCLVAHSRKPQNKDNPENHMPRPDEIEGSGDIVKQAHNIILTYRCKRKEVELQRLIEKKASHDDILEKQMEPDAVFWVRGQREGDGEEPMKHLYFDKESWQYGEAFGFQPYSLLEIYYRRADNE